MRITFRLECPVCSEYMYPTLLVSQYSKTGYNIKDFFPIWNCSTCNKNWIISDIEISEVCD